MATHLIAQPPRFTADGVTYDPDVDGYPVIPDGVEPLRLTPLLRSLGTTATITRLVSLGGNPLGMGGGVDSDSWAVSPAATISNVNSTLNSNSNSIIQITFSSASITLDTENYNPSRWSVVNSNGDSLRILNISVTINTVSIITDEQKNGETYTITVPNTGIIDNNNLSLQAPFTKTFTGVGKTPKIAYLRNIDEETVEVGFDSAMNTADALTLSNYSFTNSITPISASQVSQSIYRIKTTKFNPNSSYTLTISNVRDLVGNSI